MSAPSVRDIADLPERDKQVMKIYCENILVKNAARKRRRRIKAECDMLEATQKGGQYGL